MRASRFRPALQLFVCTNRRPPLDPLGPGCADRGEALYGELRARVAARGLGGRVWVTRTLCQGICPERGAAVSVSPGGAVLSEVALEDVGALLEDVGAQLR